MTSELAKPGIGRRYAGYALTVILLANLINYLDRFLVSVLLKDIKDAFHLTETEGQALWTAFTLGYMVAAPFIGYLSERRSRTRIFAVCIVLWSLATAGTGLASAYWELFIARILTGIGEGGCLIIGPTLISDYFTRQNRGKMLSLFYLGMPLGATAGFLVGALLADPLGWRMTFFIAGAPGILIAILIWRLMEPKRGASEEQTVHTHVIRGYSLRSYLQLLRVPSLLFIIFAQAAAVFAIIPVVHGGTEFLERYRGFTKDEAASLIGLGAVAGIFGTLVGGIVGDWLNKRTKAAYSIVAAVGYTLGMPFILLGIFAPTAWLYIPAYFCGSFFFYMCMPAVNTHVVNVVAPHQRAMAFAVTVFTLHLLGDTISPIIFGQVSKAFTPTAAFCIFPLLLLLSGWLCRMAARHATADIEKAMS